MMGAGEKRLWRARDKAVKALLQERDNTGHWEGELSNSALSTATAVTALATWEKHVSPDSEIREFFQKTAKERKKAIRLGLLWLAENQNGDGGWGDTTRSYSNISTTALGWAAFGAVADADEEYGETVDRAKEWLRLKAGGTSPHKLAEAITARYGKDRTFSVPILMMCALGGRLGRDGWRHVIQLPFEFAAFPPEMFAALRLPVVSYALPALIAIGQARHHHRPTVNPLLRIFRDLTRRRTLNVLRRIQPESGGYLEATPLTSFVTMSLAGAGNADHPVAQSAVKFLLASMRPDGSWPIDTNLATWVTTLSINALSEQNELPLDQAARTRITNWLLSQHYKTVHPYTNAAPGGWAWTDLTGGVPDADDTPGALLALNRLDQDDPRIQTAAEMGVQWLCDLQNSDGGIPTFCKGWTNLPFDRSSPDLTAHTLRAWLAWRERMPTRLREKIDSAVDEALTYLETAQGPEGSWIPLWFGNQHAPDDENPVYGTAKVLIALNDFESSDRGRVNSMADRAAVWLAKVQKPDGSWSGGGDWPASVEESALALEALAGHGKHRSNIKTGVDWLVERVERDEWRRASPIGFYFAKLWYYEKLYPYIYTVGALNRVLESVRSA